LQGSPGQLLSSEGCALALKLVQQRARSSVDVESEQQLYPSLNPTVHTRRQRLPAPLSLKQKSDLDVLRQTMISKPVLLEQQRRTFRIRAAKHESIKYSLSMLTNCRTNKEAAVHFSQK
jgi:hypothetical protein